MKIYVPSISRAWHIFDGALTDLIPVAVSGEYDVAVCVPESQYGAYEHQLERAGHLSHIEVKPVPDDIRGISRTRHWIGEQCEDDKFLMLDDDIRFMVRKSEYDWRLRACEPCEIFAMLDWVRHLLGEYAHVGISARQGNNNMGVGDHTLGQENTRTLRALAYRRREFLQMEHGRVPVMEDFDINLQLLRHGHKNFNVGYWCQDQKMTNAPGGCSTYRTHEVQSEAAERLAELHSPFVRVRTKENKTDRDGFGTRKEVTIYWKKAYEKGRYSDVRD